jgi:hypothetical protein
MLVYKQLLASDVIVTPLEVNKAFTFSGSALTGSDVGIDRFLGRNLQSNPFISGSNPTTGYISTQDQELIYDSIKQLYYSNYLSSSYGDTLNSASVYPGANVSGNVLVGTTPSPGLYYNYLQTDLTFKKYFPTGSGSGMIDSIGVISIPSRLFGNYIQPNSFRATSVFGTIYDDGEGNIIFQESSSIVGNIFYPHGMIVITGDPSYTASMAYGYGSGSYGSTTYGSSSFNNYTFIDSFVNNNITCSFSSSLTVYETQYKCTLRENEFNYSLNPSILTDTSGSVQTFSTASYFNPYVTTVGLYDEYQNLLAVGKLAQPLPTSPTTDTTVLINIDM